MYKALAASLFFFLSSCLWGQEYSKKSTYSLRLDSYVGEINSTGKRYLNYHGQTVSAGMEKPLSKNFSLIATAGFFIHLRVGDHKLNPYLYMPLQLGGNVYRADKRFGLEITAGYPVKLYEYKPYINGSTGFWYNDKAEKSLLMDDDDLETYLYHGKAHIHSRKHIFLWAQFRPWVALSKKTNPLFLSVGVKYIVYDNHYFQYTHFYSYDLPRGIDYQLNLLVGLKYNLPAQKNTP